MKNWKKGLACLLAGVMMLALLTACGGGTAGAKAGYPSAEECDALAKKIDSGLSYDRDLWNEAYQIAYWMTDSISVKEKDGEFQRIVTVTNDNWSYMEQENLGRFLFNSGCTGITDDAAVIALRLSETVKTQTGNTVAVCAPKLTDTAALRSYAKGKTKMGAAYITVGDTVYLVALFR